MENYFEANQKYQLEMSGLSAFECVNIAASITLNLSIDEFITFAKENGNKQIFYKNDLFDGSIFAGLDLEDDMFSEVKDDMEKIVKSDSQVVRTIVSCVCNGVVVCTTIVDEELVELSEIKATLIQQLKQLIAASYKEELKEALLKDRMFQYQTSQTKRLNYVKEHYSDLYKAANLSHGELTYLLDAIYNDVK